MVRILYTADPEIPVPPIHYGGVQRLVAQVSAEIQKRGHTVSLVAHPDSKAEVDLFLPFSGTRSQHRVDTVRNSIVLRRAVKRFRPDVLHSYSRLFYMTSLLDVRLPKIMSYGRSPGRRQVQWATRLFGSSLIFTGCSQHISRTGAEGGGVWKTIYNSVDLSELTFESEVSEDAPLVFLSRLERVKGAHTAIQIAKQAGKRLIIAGNRYHEGHSAQYFADEIEPELGQNGIEYIGSVDSEERNGLLRSAKALLVPIEWEEPFGLVFAEALACGTPVISTRRGAIPEIVRDGVDGFIIDTVEDGVRAVEKVDRIDRRSCRARVEEHFTLPEMVSQYEQLYRSMMK